MEITILNWRKHNPGRKDVKQHSWFRISNRILEDSDLFDLSDSEFKAMIYLFCQASLKNKETFIVSFGHAERSCGVKEKAILSAVEKLEQKQIVVRTRNEDVTRTLRVRNEDVTPHNITLHNITLHNKVSSEGIANAILREAPKIFQEIDFAKYGVTPEVWFGWVDLYQDEAWVIFETKKALMWVRDNPSKAPKSRFTRFFSAWLSRAWEWHRKNNPEGKGLRKIEEILADEGAT